jgi:hypothetical protein
MSKANQRTDAKPAPRRAEPGEPPLTRVNRTKRPVLLAFVSLALVTWIGFLAYLAWRG